jgi:hypothetical protein
VKGVAGTLGATELQIRAAVLEKALREGRSAEEVETGRRHMAEELTRLVGAIRVVMGEPTPLAEGDAEELATDIGTFPQDLVEAMRIALESGDLEELEGHARTLSGKYPGGARVLMNLCQAYDYEGLARLLGQ